MSLKQDYNFPIGYYDFHEQENINFQLNRLIANGGRFEDIQKIVDNVQGRDANRFKNGAYTIVFEYFELVCNKALGR